MILWAEVPGLLTFHKEEIQFQFHKILFCWKIKCQKYIKDWKVNEDFICWNKKLQKTSTWSFCYWYYSLDGCITNYNSPNWCTVKPVYNNHPWYPKKVTGLWRVRISPAIVDWWPLIRGDCLQRFDCIKIKNLNIQKILLNGISVGQTISDSNNQMIHKPYSVSQKTSNFPTI